MNKNFIKFLEKHIGTITIVACGLILVLPSLLTRKWDWIDFSLTGQIGDTIGGITAPVIGITTILLVYLTYSSQKEELAKTREFLEDQNKKLQLEQVVNSIENLIKETTYFIDELEYFGMKGVIAIRNYEMGKNGEIIGFLDEFNAILIRFEILLSTIRGLENTTVKGNYLDRVYTLFYSKILWNTKANIFDKQKHNIKLRNDDANLIIPKYARLSVNAIEYLIARGIVMTSGDKENNIAELRTEIK